MLQLNLRPRKGVEIQSKGNRRECHKERDGTGRMTGKKKMSRTAELGQSTSRVRLQMSGCEAVGAWLWDCTEHGSTGNNQAMD